MKFDDQPIESSQNDDLLRFPLAKELFLGIDRYDRQESFVIGVQGEWGEGKTSFVNMMLEQARKEKPGDYIIINFNPWYFTGDDQILKQFCNVFSEQLSTQANEDQAVLDAAKKIKRIAALVKPLKDIVNFAGLSIGVPGIGSILGATAEKAANFAKDLEEAYHPTEDFVELKKQIGKALEKFNKKVVVIIDDIDRLNKDEVYEVFRLVKIIADFPKTIYILSYDKQKVASFLKDKGYYSDFLDKIIQQELSLPKPDQQVIYDIFIAGVNNLVKDHEVEITDRSRQYFKEINYAGLSSAFQNLRSVKRVLNVIDFEYRVLKGQVNFIDFFILCLFKVHAPNVYEHIRLFGGNYLDGTSPKDKKAQENYTNFKKDISDEESWAIPILEAVFPALGSGNFNYSYGSDIVSGWISDRRVATSEYFKRYFVLSMSPNEVSEDVYTEIYKAAGNKDRFKAILQEHKVDQKLGKLLQMLRSRVDHFSHEDIPKVISILLDEAENLDEITTEFFSVGADGQAFYLGLDLLKSIPQEQRGTALERAIKGTEVSTNHLLHFVDHIGQDHGFIEPREQHNLMPESDFYLTKKQLDDLVKFVVERISNTDIDDLIKRRAFLRLWFILPHIERDLSEKIRTELLESENGLLKAASIFCNRVISSDIGLYRYLDFKLLRTFIEADEEKSNEEISSDIEAALEQSNDEDLNALVREGLNNANDPMRVSPRFV